MDLDFETKRTHPCNELRLADVKKEVLLKGWVDKRRDLGGLVFVDLRDRTGKVQIVFNPVKDAELHEKAQTLRSEFVIAVKGVVEKRLEQNAKLPTGEIEVAVTDLRILNDSKTPPVSISDEGNESEDVRLRYRFLDLRRPAMQRNILFRHKVLQDVRGILSAEGFVEIDTPILMKSTPEGARDFLVPSRINKGRFYALPQSPQTYKQILMVAGYDRYFQVAKCFRDEDLRADRQPEFTQIDCELSFPHQNDIYDLFGKFTAALFKSALNADIGPIPRLSYQEAMERYGSDKPDLRVDMRMHDLTPLVKESGFKIFDAVLEKGGAIKGICAKGCNDFSRKTTDELTEYVKGFGANGLVVLKATTNGCDGSAAKFFSPEIIATLLQKLHADVGDMIFIVASDRSTVNTSLGNLRLEIARRKNWLNPMDFKPLWVVDFPMFEFSKTDNRWAPCHHPFTAPLDEDVSLLYGPEYHLARAKAYDLVINGNEIGGGSIRIHQAGLQSKVFELLGISEKEAQSKFGFLLEAFKYGAPPHGGIAFGLDRLLMIMLGLSSIRDVIPFPKTTTGSSLMDDCPSEVAPDQLAELGIRLSHES
ncbi:MAG: aspartate--tRNA ligase [Elusimicrobia bacterium RIFOXYB2_FULL_49_7]|nr:MAG: aspartate--tRNA ligase [Elusimicrobia bacterium RIFOXYB2_FULL_49_7]